MDDRVESDSEAWTVAGLLPGSYLVYVYAWDSGSPALATGVRVVGSSDPEQSVAGPWNAGFALGATHSLHHVVVDASGTITFWLEPCGFCLTMLAGFQLVPEIQSFSFCEPGAAGVGNCPCANPPSSASRRPAPSERRPHPTRMQRRSPPHREPDTDSR